MGEIPSENNMIGAVFINPKNNQDIAADTTFDIEVKVANLNAGSFTNPDTTYYSAPQALGQNGNIVGHTHVSVQNFDDENNPPPTNQFAFFKGINNDVNANGNLAATVEGGLPTGSYRVCSLNSASNHQPVVMPVSDASLSEVTYLMFLGCPTRSRR